MPITITAENKADLLKQVADLFGDELPALPSSRSRRSKGAEAPPAEQPATASEAPAQPQQQPQADPLSPTVTAPAPAPIPAVTTPNPFSAPPPPFAPAAQPQSEAGVNPLARELLGLLEQLAAKFGDQQVYHWAINNVFGLSPQVTKEEFVTNLVFRQREDKLKDAIAGARRSLA